MISFAEVLLSPATKIVPRGFSLGSHRPTHRWGFSPWGVLFVCSGLILGHATSANAQGASCGAKIQASTNKLYYPPIAVVAHIAGPVVLMVSFDHDGAVSNVTAITGPNMLRPIAIDYARGLHAEPSSGSRECPFVVDFNLDCSKPSPMRSNGAAVCHDIVQSIDQAAVLGKTKHHFLLF